MSYYNRKARNVNHKFLTQVDFFILSFSGALCRSSSASAAARMISVAMSASAPSAIGSR